MSLSEEQVSLICELQAQISEFTFALEDAVEKFHEWSDSLSQNMLPLRIFLNAARNPDKTFTSRQLKAKFRGVTRRTIQRHLKRISDLGVIAEKRPSGLWGKRNSPRTDGPGKQPAHYQIHPMIRNNPLKFDNEDSLDRRLTWLALKFLIGMTAYRKCLTRQRIAFLKMVDILRPSIPLIEKIPELNPSLSDLKNASKIIQTEANPNYRFGDLANGASMRLPIEEERTDYLALRYRLPLGSEEFIPWMEAKRLRFLLYADVGWEGGNACA